MDMLTVDLTPVPQAGLGSEVTLWGVPQQSKAEGSQVAGVTSGVSIDEVALSAGTIAYELMCALSSRVPVTISSSDHLKKPS
jgi:alanine racemase